jgi:hypothetical protein
MIRITGLTQNASQKFTISDPNGGGDISIILNYRPRVQCWYIDITFKTFTLNGYKVTRGPNILSKFRNVIPFGLAVTVTDNYEPFLINDLSSGRVSLFLLTAAEVSEVVSLIAGGATVP